jgi:hypothetical protein
MEKDIHVSHKGQGAATNREKGQGVTRTRALLFWFICFFFLIYIKYLKLFTLENTVLIFQFYK